MKTLLLTILTTLVASCVSAEPPDINPITLDSTNGTVTVVAPAGVPIDGIIVYGGNHSDTNWTRVKVLQCTNLQYMAANVPKYDEYTSTSTNSATGQESKNSKRAYWPTNPPALVVPLLQLNK